MRGALVLAAALALAACGGSRTDPGAPRVRIAIGGQTLLVYLPTTLAETLGYYQEEGLDVTLQDFPGGSKALEALLGESADVVSGYYDHTVQMAAEGREMKAFVSLVRYPGLVLAAPGGSEQIESVENLKGKIVGVTAPGSSTHFFLNYLLREKGIPPQEVSVVGVGGAATAVAALERGRVDAAVLLDPAVTQWQRRNPGGAILADTRTAEGVREVFGAGAYPASVLYSTGFWIRENPDAARRLARALRRTLAWMQTHTPLEILDKMPAGFRGDREAYLDALRRSMPMYSPDGLMTQDGAEAVRRVLALSLEKVRDARIDLSATYTNEFVSGN